MLLSMVLKPNRPLAASQLGAFCGPEIDAEHTPHIYKHTVSLWSVPLIFQRLTVIGWDGLGVQGENTEDANGGATPLCLKYSSEPFRFNSSPSKDSRWWIKQSSFSWLCRRKERFNGISVGFGKRHGAAWLHYECPLSFSGLLHVPVLDYGSSLLHVITTTSNSAWQLRPVLNTLNRLNSYVFVFFALSCPYSFTLLLCLPLTISLFLSSFIYLLLHLYYFSLVHCSHLCFLFFFLFVLFAKEMAETGNISLSDFMEKEKMI